MTSGTVFQMAEAAPQNQKVLRYYRECRSDTNLRCYMHLLPGRNCSTRHETVLEHVRNSSNIEHLVDR